MIHFDCYDILSGDLPSWRGYVSLMYSFGSNYELIVSCEDDCYTLLVVRVGLDLFVLLPKRNVCCLIPAFWESFSNANILYEILGDKVGAITIAIALKEFSNLLCLPYTDINRII